MFNKIDQILNKMEKRGYNVANKLHIWTINLILCGLAYGTYTFFRDYNDFFRDARGLNEEDPTKLKEDLEVPLNRSLNSGKKY